MAAAAAAAAAAVAAAVAATAAIITNPHASIFLAFFTNKLNKTKGNISIHPRDPLPDPLAAAAAAPAAAAAAAACGGFPGSPLRLQRYYHLIC